MKKKKSLNVWDSIALKISLGAVLFFILTLIFKATPEGGFWYNVGSATLVISLSLGINGIIMGFFSFISWILGLDK